ncbi:(Fe-S)-binding protein [Hyperthermus butylicus]|uniref:4Fe-4S ferredoxin-type domain-containing protein n=1 Tax=Hyperthermus butylicus (strain DSM 5456 / JCM 9403 / PLM1-5) TaxID=415426 RepID=A2BN67_HYPBU|nr:(Fe-S)-binding protein [Hyperthermus butylicus]ABM81428.1 hypothetical protein Hbut_1610 [Hyperthermus butylicus DSM 5456]
MLKYDSFACAQCGFYEAVCTVYDAVKWPSASPRGKFYLIKQYLLGNYDFDQRALDMLYLCTTCKKCELVCQTAIPIVNHWLEMHIPMTAKGYELTSLKQIRENVLTKGSFWGVDPKERWSWLPGKYNEKRKGKVAIWSSCWESIIARNMSQNMIKILEKSWH